MISLLALWGVLSCGAAGVSICCEYNRARHIKDDDAVFMQKKSIDKSAAKVGQ
jgi:hypothetical protein